MCDNTGVGIHTGLSPDVARLNFVFPSSDMDYDNDDIKDPYISELEVTIGYFQEHLHFYQKLLDIYKKEGPKAAADYKKEHFKLLPKRLKLKPTVSGNIKALTTLKGEELLNELKKLLGASTDQSEITPFNEDEKDLEKIKAIIIQGEKTIQIKQRQDIKDAVRLGLWLDKLAKLYYSNFNTFVKDNLQFGPRWVRRLRLITRVFCKYKQLQNLSISMSAAARIVSSVEKAIDGLDSQERQFWKN
jgi:hypothetical protein